MSNLGRYYNYYKCYKTKRYWQVMKGVDGNLYCWNRKIRKREAVASQNMKKLLGPWREVPHTDGDIYYWNIVTDETTWKKPQVEIPHTLVEKQKEPVAENVQEPVKRATPCDNIETVKTEKESEEKIEGGTKVSESAASCGTEETSKRIRETKPLSSENSASPAKRSSLKTRIKIETTKAKQMPDDIDTPKMVLNLEKYKKQYVGKMPTDRQFLAFCRHHNSDWKPKWSKVREFLKTLKP